MRVHQLFTLLNQKQIQSWARFYFRIVIEMKITPRPYQKKAVKSVLNSMLNENRKIQQFTIIEENKSVAAWISNMPNKKMAKRSSRFRKKTGLSPEIKGQIPLF